MKLLYFNFRIASLLKDTKDIAGGDTVQWSSWIKGFIANGHEFGLLTYKGASTFINKRLDFDVVECYDPTKGINRLRVVYYQIPLLIKAIKKYKPDYLIQASANAHTGMIMIAAKILRIPFIHRVASDGDVDERIAMLIHKRELFLYYFGLRFSDFIFVQNTYQYDKLKLKYPKKKIFVLHNPYFLETTKADILPRKERKYISWVGNFRYVKNLPALLNAAQKLRHINFRIAGLELDEIDEITKISIFNLKKLNNVTFVGYLTRAEINKFLASSIALLNTSFTEGFSNTFLESWSLGVPVVTTKKVNPDQIVNNYNLGRVADDFEQLPDMLNIINNMEENEYNKLAIHCHEYVLDNHDPKNLAEKFVDFLNSNNL